MDPQRANDRAEVDAIPRPSLQNALLRRTDIHVHAARAAASGRVFLFALLSMAGCFLPSIVAQTAITIANASFEVPSPSTFPDYTVGATGWTRTNPAINAGTFSPSAAGTTPLPIDGVQVGYADGFGGLQQVLTDTFAANQVYTFSAYIGFRSDEVNSTQGTGALTLGYFSGGTFTALSSQSVVSNRGSFNFVTGTFQTSVAALGQPIALRLTSLDSFQVIFDQAQLSVSAIPEPATYATVFGLAALLLAGWRRRTTAVE